MKIGVDARKILRNATGLGNYGRTLVCNMSELIATIVSCCFLQMRGSLL